MNGYAKSRRSSLKSIVKALNIKPTQRPLYRFNKTRKKPIFSIIFLNVYYYIYKQTRMLLLWRVNKNKKMYTRVRGL